MLGIIKSHRMIISPDLHQVSLQCVGILWLCCLSGSAHLLKAHAHFHCATTVPPSRDLARQEALLFLRRFVLSFFVPPIFTVFYLIDRVTKNRKRRGCEGGYQLPGRLVKEFTQLA